MKGIKTGGRQKGTPNKASIAKAEEIAASGLTPLDFMIDTMRDIEKEYPVRLDAAKAAAPYIHPKLSSVEVTGKDGGPVETVALTPLEYAKRMAFMLKKAEKELEK